MQSDILLETLRLEWKRVATSCNISAQVIADAEVHEWFEPMADMLAVSLSTFILTDQLGAKQVTRVAEVPATWWQHTKMVHFPTFSRWLRRPPRMRNIELVVDVEDTVSFPHTERAYPRDLGRPVFLRSVTIDFSTPE